MVDCDEVPTKSEAGRGSLARLVGYYLNVARLSYYQRIVT